MGRGCARECGEVELWVGGGGGGGGGLLYVSDFVMCILIYFSFTFFMHFSPGMMATQSESINSDLQRGLD